MFKGTLKRKPKEFFKSVPKSEIASKPEVEVNTEKKGGKIKGIGKKFMKMLSKAKVSFGIFVASPVTP